MVSISDIPIYVINLPSRLERKEKMIAEFKKQKIDHYQFIQAIHGETLNMEEMLNKGMVNYSNRILSRGQVGCFLSHVSIFKSIIENSHELAIIFEDDVYFVNTFKHKLHKILNNKNLEWDIFYIGINYPLDEHKKYRKGKVVDKKLGVYHPKYLMWGTHAYLIKNEAAKKIINNIFPITLPIDVFLINLEVKRLFLLDTIANAYNKESDTTDIV